MADQPKRKSPRLQGYDYATTGGYFITICTHNKRHLFGKVENDKMILSEIGEIAEQCWKQISQHFSEIVLDQFVVMPNHIHGIIFLQNPENELTKSSLSTVIGSYKAAVTRTVKKQQLDSRILWQSRFHDHIIRNEQELNFIRRYVHYNPAKWAEDRFYSNE